MKRIIFVFILFNILYGCEDVLDKAPLDEITEEVYWKSVTDLELYVNQFYPAFRGQENYFNLDENSDNLKPASISEVLNGTRSIPSTGGGWSWNNIRQVNYYIENMGSADVGDKVSIDHLKGEGYFFRAFFYFDKVKRFGDVPWYDKVLNIDSEELYSERASRKTIVEYILDDLDMAIDLLQEKNQIGTNRINKESALLFKSRVCLYEGTWEKYHNGTVFGVQGSNGEQFIQLAADAAEAIMKTNSFSLYSTNKPDEDYWKLFNRVDLTDNEEAILVQSVDPGQDLGHWTWTYLNGTRGRATGITNSLVKSYLDINGIPISQSEVYKGDSTLNQVVENRDPRLKQTMWVPGQIQILSDPPMIFEYPALHRGAFDGASTGYMIRKGGTTDPEQNTGTSSDNYGATDAMVFRYSEALLNYAEAKAELGTLNQEDLDKSINLIRGRVGMPGLNIEVGFTDPNWNFPGLSPIINEIRRERRIELALEGFRYDDMMRWAAHDLVKGKRWKGAKFIKGISFPAIEDQIADLPVDENGYIDRYQSDIPNGFGFDEKRDYLYPLPTTELTLNQNLEQNPGW